MMHEHGHASAPSTTALALAATRHCLTGCAIGEIVGVVLAAAIGLSAAGAMLLGILLAFVFGYGFTFVPLVRSGMTLGSALPVTLAADTVSIVVMEAVDNLFVLLVPGAASASPTDVLFWGSLIVGLVIAFAVAFPVNRWLIGRGLGHAVVHGERQ